MSRIRLSQPDDLAFPNFLVISDKNYLPTCRKLPTLKTSRCPVNFQKGLVLLLILEFSTIGTEFLEI